MDCEAEATIARSYYKFQNGLMIMPKIILYGKKKLHNYNPYYNKKIKSIAKKYCFGILSNSHNYECGCYDDESCGKPCISDKYCVYGRISNHRSSSYHCGCVFCTKMFPPYDDNDCHKKRLPTKPWSSDFCL